MNPIKWATRFFQPGVHWVWLSGLIYLVACCLPAYKVGFGGNDTLYGWQCLMLYGVPWWWSNPLYFVAIVTYAFKLRRTTVVLSGLSLLPALQLEFFTWADRHPILLGCILWTVSLQLVFLNALWHSWVDRKQRLESLSSTDPV